MPYKLGKIKHHNYMFSPFCHFFKMFSTEYVNTYIQAVLGIKFFPFLNLLAIILVVAVGADDAFLFMYQYRKHKRVILFFRLSFAVFSYHLSHSRLLQFETVTTSSRLAHKSIMSSLTLVEVELSDSDGDRTRRLHI